MKQFVPLAMSPDAFEKYLKDLERTGTNKDVVNKLRMAQKEGLKVATPECDGKVVAKSIKELVTGLQKVKCENCMLNYNEREAKRKNEKKMMKKLHAQVADNKAPKRSTSSEKKERMANPVPLRPVRRKKASTKKV